MAKTLGEIYEGRAAARAHFERKVDELIYSIDTRLIELDENQLVLEDLAVRINKQSEALFNIRSEILAAFSSMKGDE